MQQVWYILRFINSSGSVISQLFDYASLELNQVLLLRQEKANSSFNSLDCLVNCSRPSGAVNLYVFNPIL